MYIPTISYSEEKSWESDDEYCSKASVSIEINGQLACVHLFCSNVEGCTSTCVNPQTAREIASHLIFLADKLEGKE